jgi:DNA-binding Xre family transcriptional regulator
LGSSQHTHAEQDRSHNFLRFRGIHGPVARVHQEDAKDAEIGNGTSPFKAKGDGSMKSNPHIGSTLEDFLKEEGIFEDATNHAVKRILAWQVEKAMQEQRITKVEMARRMGTSRAHLDKLLDPENDKVQLDTVQRAAAAIGRQVRLELV